MRARHLRMAVGALAVLVASSSAAVVACSAILDTDRLDRNRCDAPGDCTSGQTCDLAQHVCAAASDATAASDGAGSSGPDAASDGGVGELPVSDWQYEFSTDSTLTLAGVAVDPSGNVLVVGTGGSEVSGQNNASGAAQGIFTSRYPEAFYSGFTGDARNVIFNDKTASDDSGTRTPMALFAADLVDAGSTPDPMNAPLLVATLVPGSPTVLALEAYRYDATGVSEALPSPTVRQKITLETLAAPEGGAGARDAGDAAAAAVTTLTVAASLRTSDGALYLAGSFAGVITVDKTMYTSLLDPTGVPSNDGFIVRFDPAGAPPQTWVFATPDDDTVSSLCDVNGELGIGGVFTTPVGGGPLLFQGAPSGIVGAGKGDGFFAVMSESTGTLGLAQDIGGAGQEAVRAVAYLPASNQILVGGRAQMPLAIGHQEFDAGSDDEFALLAAFDATSGVVGWANLYPTGSLNGPGSADTTVARLTVLPGSGDILVGGTFAGALDVGAGPLSSAARSGFLAHLAADGGAHWSALLGDSIHDVLLDPGGGVLVTGLFTHPLALAADASFAPTGLAEAGAVFLAHFPAP